jgi:thiosulfate/3-mercaptopyruvate sulfurtransferase
MTASMSPLVSCDWLASHLGASDLRVYDCTMILKGAPATADRPELNAMTVESGRDGFETAHIPGSGFLDLQDLSDPQGRWRFTMPAAQALAEILRRRGIGRDDRVVLYSAAAASWATRVWWMLRAIGFDRAAILDGGLPKWRAEGRPVESGSSGPAPASLAIDPRPRADLFVGKDEMLAALQSGAPSACLLNALSEAQHRGTGGWAYGRAGRIAGSRSLPAAALVGADGAFLPEAEMKALFEAQGVRFDDPAQPVLCYCGGGVAATVDSFALVALLGRERVAVYDASMQEWASDPSLPMERG